jgi:hypothetical protein
LIFFSKLHFRNSVEFCLHFLDFTRLLLVNDFLRLFFVLTFR